MWTTTIVLLSCLYPIFLFFVIGYTYFYTTQKAAITASIQSQPVDLTLYSFRTPDRTTVSIQTAALTTVKASVSANEDVRETAKVAIKEAEVSLESEQVSTKSAQPESSDSIQEVSQPLVTPIPTTAPNIQNAVQAVSVKIMNNASNMIIPSASSIILESESAFERVGTSASFE
jgi:hypothetical protein